MPGLLLISQITYDNILKQVSASPQGPGHIVLLTAIGLG